MYSLENFDHFIKLDNQTSGANEKVWLQNPDGGNTALFKFAKVNNGKPCGEYWSEKMASDFAKVLGLDCMKVSMGYYGGRLGSLCWNIAETHGSFTQMDELVIPRKDYCYTLDQIRGELNDYAYKSFIRMLIFDYLIGNNDRHLANFGVLDDNSFFAPLYDNGSSLACRLDNKKMLQMGSDDTMYEAFAFRRPSSKVILSDNNKPAKHMELIAHLRQTNHQYYFRNASEIYETLSPSLIRKVLYGFLHIISESTWEIIQRTMIDRAKLLL